ncbi:pentatricopeptide repeat-containing protein At4g13650 [Telopea speciosissima]|uniref:pentatricopeptide repeat-containing protein At4g13650 n=1 Tax=Telopea speciosissima TaxID=54955 RepID=UPI001CC81FFA|nr:pentatricopeptide repeat-containing protein At4g13650 [Telopea speciosissima]XP_043706810.1 pentatricopeptide repeat-containing protein At4g13650 [Telopea speciosissima]XP_043706811.1 pentatricopeptide repeat-containing protein At4g13650 [Telopea speciosissima]XP_043706812.1 pentatricopeptide repeat-containing protein At4g13650 [Telopea speciosissima]XP_043706813.1 pentatricopeptide repeat-containing protein At4g13650 [Telopea speciosissima]XP_043706814.1 pentatricopeptide repeat-containing
MLMVPATFSLHGSFSNSWMSSLFPRKFTEQTAFANFRKLFVANFGRLNSVGNISTAICHGFDKFSDGEMGEDVSGNLRKEGFYFLHSMEIHGIPADFNTYLWLLKGCQNSGSLTHAKQLHGRILKLGFDSEPSLCNELIDIYSGYGDLDDAIEVLATFSQRSVYSWNSIISGALARKSNRRVLSLFSQMLADHVNPDEGTFINVLRACVGANVAIHFIEQIHAKIIRKGFATYPVVCNPLIDLFSKNGFVDSAQFIFEELCSKSSISWVAMISGFAQNGREEEALLFFCQMRKLNIKPTPYVFSSVLSACTKIDFFRLGEQLHAQVFKMGFSSETFVCNALITLYCRCINLIAAEQIFTGMNHRDGITYNSLISGLAQQGKSDKAFQLFGMMQLTSLKPDCVTIASLLSVCASVGAFDKGKQLHSYSVKAGISSDIIIEGSLLDLYVKCSDIATAHEFFNITAKENVVLWNVMLVAYGQLGHLRESSEIFSQMQVAGMKPNQYTYPSILRTCTSLGALDLGEQIHAHVIKTGFEHNVYVCSVLIDMYAKHKKLVVAREILEGLIEDDVVSWTAMIAGYAQHEFYVDAIRLFEEMQIRRIQSDNIGLSSALSACAGIQALNLGQQIHAQSCISGYSMDLSIGNALVSLYARCGRLQEAYSAFETIDVKDEISWNGLISGFAQSGHCEDALQVFVQMNQAGLDANLFTFGSAVSAAANIADIKPGKQIHARMIKTGYDYEIEAGNVLITLYAKCGNIDDARRQFSQMLERNEVSWNAMITGYSQHGCGSEALDLFEEMKQQGFSPNHVTFVGVLSACSHVGLVREGLNYFKSMNDEHGIVPRPEHYACVVDILGRAGMLDHARKFIKEMPIEPDAMIWRTLLSASAVHKNTEIGEFSAQHLVELEPQDSATYVLLSNIYAVARKWDRRDQTRQMMKERGVKKEPGRSWIEAENNIHSFFVGDRLHPLSDKIYEFLEDLNERLAEIGYVQDHCSLLHDIEQGNKDPTAYIHSEKLAVSFGLISLSPAIPIRVIKNLRVCNDCHNWMKFVSKVSNRVVVVRDAYRFHHFEGGICSCRDYW